MQKDTVALWDAPQHRIQGLAASFTRVPGKRQRMQNYHILTGFFFGLLIIIFSPTLTSAAEFRVNTGYDVNDLSPGNGLCVAYLIIIPPFVLPFCSLRGAIEETNALPGPDIITLPSGTFPLELNGINEDMCATGDLDVTDTVTIRGAGPNETFIDGRSIDRVFDLLNKNSTVSLEDMTITHGKLPELLHYTQKGGGGIRNLARLTLRNVVVANNRVNGSHVGDVGGGLFNQSTCTVAKSTIENNYAQSGGGIFNNRYGTLGIYSSTINENTASSGAGLANEGSLRVVNVTISGNATRMEEPNSGGGIFNTAKLNILQSTIANNSASSSGGGIWNTGSVSLINSIIANNANGNCNPTASILSLGNNLDSENICFPGSAADIVNADPRLESLAENGGPTKTHGLIIGSPAIDSGKNLTSEGIVKDQRGMVRPDGDGYDIGAYETRKKAPPSCLAPILL